MNALAHSIIRTLSRLLPLLDDPKPPEPANDNISPEKLAQYVRDVRAYSSADYLPAWAKLWWIP